MQRSLEAFEQASKSSVERSPQIGDVVRTSSETEATRAPARRVSYRLTTRRPSRPTAATRGPRRLAGVPRDPRAVPGHPRARSRLGATGRPLRPMRSTNDANS
jgi:hypothetical protein